jgi:hypothetical protein
MIDSLPHAPLDPGFRRDDGRREASYAGGSLKVKLRST